MESRTKPTILIGWRRKQSEHGCVLTLQLAGSAADVRSGALQEPSVVMNDRQLRSLARDLSRAADEKGIDLFARPTWWKRLLTLSRRDRL